MIIDNPTSEAAFWVSPPLSTCDLIKQHESQIGPGLNWVLDMVIMSKQSLNHKLKALCQCNFLSQIHDKINKIQNDHELHKKIGKWIVYNIPDINSFCLIGSYNGVLRFHKAAIGVGLQSSAIKNMKHTNLNTISTSQNLFIWSSFIT